MAATRLAGVVSKRHIDTTGGRVYITAMARIPFTLRVDAQERLALEHLSKLEGRPINQLVNEAIRAYLRQRGRTERSLEANLEGLRAYRKKDPGFRRAIAAFVEAEASLEDPLEGEIVEPKPAAHEIKPSGPTQRKIRKLLGV